MDPLAALVADLSDDELDRLTTLYRVRRAAVLFETHNDRVVRYELERALRSRSAVIR